MKEETGEEAMGTRRRRGIIFRLRSKVVIIPLALVFVACASWYVSVARVPVIPVTVADVHRGALISTLPATGTLLPEKQVTVQSKMAGTIKKVYVEDGDSVRKGDLLVELESEMLQNQILQAESAYLTAKANVGKLTGSAPNSAIESAKANVKQAELAFAEADRNVKSSKILYDAKAIAREQLDMSKSAYEKAKLSLGQAKKQVHFAKTQITGDEKEAAEAQLRQAELNLQNTQKQLENVKITAPISGRVSFQTQGLFGSTMTQALEEGMMVTQGMALFHIVDMEHLQVKAYVDELQAKDIHTGQQVEITPESFPDKVLSGQVVKVGTQTTQQGGLPTVEIFADVKDKRGLELKIGSNVDVNIVTAYRSRALIIPQEAVKEEGGKKAVYVVTKGKTPIARRKLIRTGLETAQGVEVLKGLKENEKVVLKGKELLKDGIRVKFAE